MEEKQFLWGLSFGISFLGIAGVFWLGLGISTTLKSDSDWHLWLLLTIIQVIALVCSIWAALQLRRQSGFTRKDFRIMDEQKKRENRLIRLKFLFTALVQTILIIAIVEICNIMKKPNHIWILTSLIVSLHFFPLSKIFTVPAYKFTGLFGVIISLIALSGLLKTYTVLLLGSGMSLIMWISAFYIFNNADKITDKAVKHKLSIKTL